ncbi:DUF1450 domain-containing protein [Paenibacillus sp. GCM10012306]|uniref:DUF1450 domain-containing protein n=1 Tax=Paenibacillus sp. GCM10012306 TaxID=3317342 RepID=UPI003618B48F
MSLGLVVVEVCTRNSIAALPLEDLEDEFPEVAIMRTDCLTMCNMCRAVPYVMVGNKRVYAKTMDQCLELAKEAIAEEIKAFWEA